MVPAIRAYQAQTSDAGAPKIASHDGGFKTCTWGTAEILMEDE